MIKRIWRKIFPKLSGRKIKVEVMGIDGKWHDITEDVHAEIAITHKRTDGGPLPPGEYWV